MFKPYLLALKANYTKYVLENILNLSTVNAIRNYELLKQYESLGTRTFDVEEYKKILGIEKKYTLNADLKRYVLDAAVEEINRNADIFISYKFIGRGKKAKITFTIRPNEPLMSLSSETSESKASALPSENDGLTEFESDLLRLIPEEVHQNDLFRAKAIEDIARKYIIANFLDFLDVDENDGRSNLEKVSEATHMANEDCNDRILNAINTFNVREYNVRKNTVKSPYAYYQVAFEGWLKNNR